MDTVFIKGLSISTIIGAYGWERQVEQLLIFNVEMSSDVRKAAASDDLADALNYAAVGDTIKDIVQSGQFKLVETAAERVAEHIMKEYGVSWIRLEVSKPRPYSGGHAAGVLIERRATSDPGEFAA
ncbi:MAG: dihydroneopterin aldolase [Mycobacteriales bacterium]